MRKTNRYPLLIITITLILFVVGCGNPTTQKAAAIQNTNTATAESSDSLTVKSQATTMPSASGKLIVHFIDVGQGDSELLQLPNGQNILIDAGIPEEGPTVVSYIKSLGVKKIDYIIATHSHADHIGGMELVIKSFPIGKIYMTRGSTTTETFKDLLLTIKAKGMTINTAKAGVTVVDQNGLKISFLAPCGNDYEDLNNWSAVTKVQFGNTSFLFTGDAQELSESEMLQSGVNLKADVLKVGHHGSHSSTSPAFLKAVAPKYAVISVGKDNDYGHPHQITLDKLSAAGVTVYRTDQNGTVVITSDCNNLSIKTRGSSIQPRAPNAVVNTASPAALGSGKYIGNKNSKKFHLPSCSSLPAEKNRVYFNSREEAINAGYSPCGICKP